MVAENKSLNGKRWTNTIPLPYPHPLPRWLLYARYGCGGPGCHFFDDYGFWTTKAYRKHYREAHLGEMPSGGFRATSTAKNEA